MSHNGSEKTKYLLFVIGIIVLALTIQYIPVWNLKTTDMKVKQGQYVDVYYQNGDEKGAFEVFDLLESTAKQISDNLKYSREGKTKMFVYKEQRALHIRKVGYITLLFAPGWFIGDNKKDVAMMVSPYAQVSEHTHDSILAVAPHELIHTINYQINPKLSYWLDNGVAGYLSKQTPPENLVQGSKIPTFKDTKTENQLKFGKIVGYQYSYLYIEYLDKTYGWDKVVRIVKGESYSDVFSKSEEAVYSDWVLYLKR